MAFTTPHPHGEASNIQTQVLHERVRSASTQTSESFIQRSSRRTEGHNLRRLV